mmetsp:Transcript_34515/g.79792  ORF Transcript_34515/g.79792 Transcript_34515/m.79792 type:complete len:413 (-) Transcript_34515:362-1600(-)
MGEIEHFVNPKDKKHPNFSSIADKELILFGRDDQLGSGKTIKVAMSKAVSTGLVNNETLGYFMARTQLYMEKIGMDPSRLRFRQHLTTEMAHYATDCWDLEIQSSYGWVECVGHADRACYDLEVHSRDTKTPMLATLKYDNPVDIEVAKLKFDRKLMGMAFKKDQRVVSAALDQLAENWDDFEKVATALEKEGTTVVDGYTVTKDMVSWKKASKKVHEIKFTPSVIEPSFGMGRILYSLLEHSFYKRESDEKRTVMKFNPLIAPTKVAVFPISSRDDLNIIVDGISSDFLENDISTRVDKSTAALGRRYSRADEVGVPFAITVDFQTLEDETVTLRERDSTVQVRLGRHEVAVVIGACVAGKMKWDDILKKYPVVQVSEGEEGEQESPNVKTVIDAVTKIEVNSRGTFSRPA